MKPDQQSAIPNPQSACACWFWLIFTLSLLCGFASAQTEVLKKTLSTGNINTGFDLPTGQTITIESGASLVAASGSTITGFGSSGLTIGTSTITGATNGYALYNNAGILGQLNLASIYAALSHTHVSSAITDAVSASGTPSVILKLDASGILGAMSFIDASTNGVAVYASQTGSSGHAFYGSTTHAAAETVAELDAQGGGLALKAGSTTSSAWLTVDTSGHTTIGGGTTASELRLLEPSAGGSSYTGFKAPALAGNVIYTLPTALPGAGEQKTWVVDENGVMTLEEFATLGTGVATALAVNVGTAGSFVVNGGALGTPSSGTGTNITGIPPANVTGTAAILGANTFTTTQTINQVSASGNSQVWQSNGVEKAYMRHDGFLMVPGIGVGFDTWYNSGQSIVAGWAVLNATNGIYVNSLANHGPTAFDQGQALSGSGAVNLTKTVTKYTSSGATDALTLANGEDGQIKIIVHVADSSEGVLTPATATGYSTLTFTNAGDSATLQFFTSIGWIILTVNGTTITP